MSYRASHIVWQGKAFLISFLVSYIGTALIYKEYTGVKTRMKDENFHSWYWDPPRTLLVSFLQFPIYLTHIPEDLDC